jgi:hypothetical protein
VSNDGVKPIPSSHYRASSVSSFSVRLPVTLHGHSFPLMQLMNIGRQRLLSNRREVEYVMFCTVLRPRHHLLLLRRLDSVSRLSVFDFRMSWSWRRNGSRWGCASEEVGCVLIPFSRNFRGSFDWLQFISKLVAQNTALLFDTASSCAGGNPTMSRSFPMARFRRCIVGRIRILVIEGSYIRL